MAVKAIGDMAIFYGDKQNNGQYDNGVWMDILDIPFLAKLEEAGLYKTIIRTLWLESTGWSKEIKNRYPHVKLIGLSDHPLSTHISRLPANQQHAYISDLEYLDGIMALTEEERQWYSITVPSKPVEYVGLPFPTESYENKYGHLRNSEKDFIGLGVGAADNDRNFVSNLMAFRYLQLKNPDIVGVFLSVPQQLLPYCVYWADRLDNVFIQEREDMPEFYEALSRCKFVINLADRNTPGRIQGEAAFFEVPVIGSDRLELQNILYPTLATNPFAIEDVVTNAQYLLDNPEKGVELAKLARKKLEKFNYKRSKERFNNLLQRIEASNT
jgi:glycosyltransferase involved in cell wall biosynthesis